MLDLKAMIVATRAQGGVRLRFISTTSPLYAGRLTAKGGNEDSSNAATSITSSDNNISDEKKAMIDRWMKWNTTNNWKYTPNPDLIAKIGKGARRSKLEPRPCKFEHMLTLPVVSK